MLSSSKNACTSTGSHHKSNHLESHEKPHKHCSILYIKTLKISNYILCPQTTFHLHRSLIHSVMFRLSYLKISKMASKRAQNANESASASVNWVWLMPQRICLSSCIFCLNSAFKLCMRSLVLCAVQTNNFVVNWYMRKFMKCVRKIDVN